MDLKVLRILAAIILFAIGSSADPLIGARRPCPSPDGTVVAFDYQGDIWLAPAMGGQPKRIIANEAYDYAPIFSPDGSWIAFCSDREGSGDIFIVPAAGGMEQRITFHSAWDYPIGWSGDSKSLLFSSRRYELKGCVYRIDLDGGLPIPVINHGIQEGALDPAGNRLAVSLGANPWWRKHYRGSAGGELWIKDLAEGSWEQLTNTAEDERFPCWSASGDSLFYVAEVDSIPNLHCLDLGTSNVTILTRLASFGTRFPRTSHTGIIFYESGRRLFALEPPYTKPREIVIQEVGGCRGSDSRFIDQDSASGFALSHNGNGLVVTARGQLIGFPMVEDDELLSGRRLIAGALRTDDPSWSPEDDKIVYAGDRKGTWDIYTLKPEDGSKNILLADRWIERSITMSFENDRRPAFSPDKKWIAFIRDQRELCVVSSDGGNVTVVHNGYNLTNFSWSPDSRFLAFSRTTLEWREDLFVVARDGGEEFQLTRHPNDDFQPLWDPEGRWLVFASRNSEGEYALKMVFLTEVEFEKTREDRLIEEIAKKKGENKNKDEKDSEKKKIPQIRFEKEDIHMRVRTVTTVEGDYYRYALSPDGETLVFKAETYDGYDLYIVDVWGKNERTRITKGGKNPQEFYFGPNGKRIYYRNNKGKLFSVDTKGKDNKSLPIKIRLRIDTGAERRQMFDEGWRLLRDGFYDSTMHGKDWEHVHEQYIPLIDPCGTEPEFYNLLREMIGELGASHLGVWRNNPAVPGTGELGIIPDEHYAGEGVRIADVIHRSPAWLKRSELLPGDVILAVNGESVSSDELFFDILQGTVDNRVVLDVEGKEGHRVVSISPISRRTLRNLLIEEWIEENRAFVDSLSDNRVGYLYVRAMGNKNWLRFQRDFLAYNFNKEALIIDVRGNAGGRIHNQILEILVAKAHSFRIERNGTRLYDPHIRWEKPLAVLMDERSYSDGEIFPSAVKSLGIGTLIGVPTNGSVIGTNDVKLLDGTTFRIPSTGWWTIDGEALENNGVQPDIYVERYPEEHAQGKDSQLDRAVEEMVKAIQD